LAAAGTGTRARSVLGYRYRQVAFTSTTHWVDDSHYGGFVNTNYFVGTANANPALDTRLALYKGDKVTTDMKLEYACNSRLSVLLSLKSCFHARSCSVMRRVGWAVSSHSDPVGLACQPSIAPIATTTDITDITDETPGSRISHPCHP
jgi:hypothetical protein